MSQKNATPTREQAEAMKRAGIYAPVMWAVIKEERTQYRIINRATKEVLTIPK